MQTQGKEFTLPSGAMLYVTPAPMRQAKALLDAILKETKGLSLKSDILDTKLGSLKDNPEMFAQFLDKVVAVAISPEVENAVFECGHRAVYNGAKLTRDVFDDPNTGEKARGDYYAICMKIAEVNCLPFLATVFSGLKGFLEKAAENRASQLKQTLPT